MTPPPVNANSGRRLCLLLFVDRHFYNGVTRVEIRCVIKSEKTEKTAPMFKHSRNCYGNETSMFYSLVYAHEMYMASVS